MLRGTTSRDEGAVAIVVALLAVALFGFAALVVDVGNGQNTRTQLQNAADSAALAGEQQLASWAHDNPTLIDPSGLVTSTEQDDLVVAVKSAVNADYPIADSEWTTCTDAAEAGYNSADATSCIQYRVTSTGGAVTGTAVRVRIPRQTIPSTFGGALGTAPITAAPVAAAQAGQGPPSPCRPCDPRFDGSTGQPVSQATLPDSPPSDIRSELPYPADLQPGTVNGDDAPVGPGCPVGPGLFTDQAINVASGAGCTLPAGLYVFDGTSRLDVSGPLVSTGAGVTLVFYDSARITVDAGGSLTLVAPAWTESPVIDAPIPGVAIVIDQSPASTEPPVSRTFSLGAGFDITGSVYALDGSTTWQVADGDCPTTGTCYVHDNGSDAVIAVTATDLPDVNGSPVVPTVGSDHQPPLPPPSPEHLTE